MKLALADDSPSSQAVLYALLSLATLHSCREGPRKAIEFKSSALNCLQQCASKGNFTNARAMQHMAAAILLCRVEVRNTLALLTSRLLIETNIVLQIALAMDATTVWCLYVCGVNTLLVSTYDKSFPEFDPDIRLLYRYVHYHNGISCFSLIHWRRPRALQSGTQVDFRGKIVNFKCRGTFHVGPHSA